MLAALLPLLGVVRGADLPWDTPNILLDGNPSKWVVVPDPFTDGKPFPPKDDKWKRADATIVVLVAALRESRLPNTLYQMLSKYARLYSAARSV